jgi:hypothetical protein
MNLGKRRNKASFSNPVRFFFSLCCFSPVFCLFFLRVLRVLCVKTELLYRPPPDDLKPVLNQPVMELVRGVDAAVLADAADLFVIGRSGRRFFKLSLNRAQDVFTVLAPLVIYVTGNRHACSPAPAGLWGPAELAADDTPRSRHGPLKMGLRLAAARSRISWRPGKWLSC